MPVPRWTEVWSALALLAAAALPLAAQGVRDRPLAIVSVQALSFGPLRPGTPVQIRTGDAGRRGEAVLEGAGKVDLLLTLPDALRSAAGGEIPLRFGPGDAAFQWNASAAPQAFDPRDPMRVNLSRGNAAPRLLLGATAVPAPEVPAGSYAATVRVMLVRSGT